MAVDYDVLEYTINALVEKLMLKYDTNYGKHSVNPV